MKAVVVSPSICDFYFTPSRANSLGALCVHNLLLKKGIYSKFINLPLLSPRGHNIPIPKMLNYLDPYIIKGEKGCVSFFNKYKIFGPNPKKSGSIILSHKPDIIFISLFAWAYADDAIELVKSIKEQSNKSKKIIIVIGGAGVSVMPEYFFKTGSFDFILTGEAEDVIDPLMDYILHKNIKISDIPNIYTPESKNNQISTGNPEPIVSFHSDKCRKQWFSVVLSKGCPLMCSFCSNHLTQGRIMRCTDIIKLKNEFLKNPVKSTEPLHINLEDDNLLIRKRYFKDVLIMIKGLYKQATFSIDNGLDYTLMDDGFLHFLISIGFTSFTFSLGSSDLEILKKEKRPADLNKLKNLLSILQKEEIPTKTFLICGLPEDTKDTIINSLIFMHNLPTESCLSLFYPVPGIIGFEDKEGFLNRPSHLCCNSSVYPWSNSLSTHQMVTVFRLSRISNLIKKKTKSIKEEMLINKILNDKIIYTFYSKNYDIIPVLNLDQYMIEQFLRNIKE